MSITKLRRAERTSRANKHNTAGSEGAIPEEGAIWHAIIPQKKNTLAPSFITDRRTAHSYSNRSESQPPPQLNPASAYRQAKSHGPRLISTPTVLSRPLLDLTELCRRPDKTLCAARQDTPAPTAKTQRNKAPPPSSSTHLDDVEDLPGGLLHLAHLVHEVPELRGAGHLVGREHLRKKNRRREGRRTKRGEK